MIYWFSAEQYVDPKIYGVSWDGSSSPIWTRTDDAVGFSDPSPALGTGTGSSPFDGIMPWAGMVKVNDPDAGMLVAIPKYYFKLDKSGSTMSLKISSAPFTGSQVSPAHMDRGDGKGEREYVYVGRHHCASDFTSTTGVAPKVSTSRADFRTGIHNLGSNIWQWDYATLLTIQMLYLVEFANFNSQTKIGYGCSDSGTKQNTGLTDTMTYHTGTNKSSRTTYGHVQYRNIEDLWANVGTHCDGIRFNGSSIYAIKNPSSFSDTSGGTSVGTKVASPQFGGVISSYAISSASGFTWFMFPSGYTDIENISQYSCDAGSFHTDSGYYQCLEVGGMPYQDLDSGLFSLWDGSTGATASDIGSRLMKLP